MDSRELAAIRDYTNVESAVLSDPERRMIVRAALSLAMIRRRTISDPHMVEALALLRDIAPSLSTELRRLLDITDAIHARRQEGLT